MKTNEIKKLIESFYDGKTSQSEELLLFKYFSNDDVAEDLLEEKEIFLQLHESEPIDLPSWLCSNIESTIDTLTKKESKKKLSGKRIVMWSSIAASVAILALAGIYMNNLSIEGDNSMLVKKQHKNTLHVTDAEYMEAENAMRLLSYNFNKGMQQLDEMHENLEKTNRILNETFKKN